MKHVHLGHQRAGLHVQRRDIGDLIAYISQKSGEYDRNERDLMDDPYVLGFDAYNAGMSLDEAQVKYAARLRSRREFVEQRKKLIEKGFRDAENG